MNNNKSGRYSEFLARTLLFLKGYKILVCNFKTGNGTHAGEIDFIAQKGRTIVFVEVKKRKNIDTAAYSISDNQKHRIINGAKSFLKRNSRYENYDKRFDAILVMFPFYIKHIQNAWEDFT
ncbi:MAG: YraN family protein [Lactobacillaceae bacterium]|jgi:putative endonuclease|nr:YraN family protein [Lactobacillaceae bacterium]